MSIVCMLHYDSFALEKEAQRRKSCRVVAVEGGPYNRATTERNRREASERGSRWVANSYQLRISVFSLLVLTFVHFSERVKEEKRRQRALKQKQKLNEYYARVKSDLANIQQMNELGLSPEDVV